MSLSPRIIALAACGAIVSLTHSARAQNALVNGGFETQALAPWTVAATPAGVSFGTAVIQHDIDGPGPMAPSFAVRLLVGQSTPGTGHQGVSLTQVVTLDSDFGHELRFDWSIAALIGFQNATAARFEILVNDEVFATLEAPRMATGERLYGRMGVRLTEVGAGPRAVSIRVTRPVPAGEEIFQHIDNVRLRVACVGDVDEDGRVGFGDLNAVLAQFGQTAPGAPAPGAPGGWPGFLTGDANFDGVVNMADLNHILSRFGVACPTA